MLLEHEGLYPPIGWLHELTIIQGPLFTTPQKVQLSKLNLIYGMNETGKTALTEWIMGFFDPKPLERWIPATHSPLNLRLSLLNPKLQHLGLKIEATKLDYSIGGEPVAFIPIAFKIFKPGRMNRSIKDDREMLAQALTLSLSTMESLIAEVNAFPHAKVSNMRFEQALDESGNCTDRWVLRVDVEGTVPGLTLRSLSGREGERIMLELITAAARLSGRYCPTLLVLDESISIVFEGFFDFYTHHLLDPLNHFQTLMCIAKRDLDLENVKWNGWQVIRTNGHSPNVTLTQDVRNA